MLNPQFNFNYNLMWIICYTASIFLDILDLNVPDYLPDLSTVQNQKFFFKINFGKAKIVKYKISLYNLNIWTY